MEYTTYVKLRKVALAGAAFYVGFRVYLFLGGVQNAPVDSVWYKPPVPSVG